MGKVLIVYHTLGGNTEKAAQAVAEGAREVKGTQVTLKKGLEASVDDLLGCDAIAVGTPDFFSYMAGGLKDFFDRTCYPTEGKVTGKPCAIFVTHGGGGKAVKSVEEMCRRFQFQQATEPVLVLEKPDREASKKLREAGRKLAEAAKG